MARSARIEGETGLLSRPMVDNKPVNVKVGLFLTNLIDVDESQRDLPYQRLSLHDLERPAAGTQSWRLRKAQTLCNANGRAIHRDLAALGERLAWNLGKWIAQLALPAEVVRWEWKRFRRHFVYIAAKVLKKGRRLIVQLTGSHRYLPQVLAAHARLQV